MKNYIQPGNTMTFVAPSGGVTSGVGLVIEDMFVVPTVSAAQGVAFEGLVAGIVRLPKTSAATFNAGDKLYFVPGTGAVGTATTSGNFLIGCAAVVGTNGQTTTLVRLNGTTVTAL